MRSKRLFEPASAPPVRSKWPLWPVRCRQLFESVSSNRPQPAKLSSREMCWVLNFNFNFSERHFIFQLQLELLMFDASRFNAVEGMLG